MSRCPEEVPIIMDYFTAWPTAEGEIVVYDDVYGREAAATCEPEEAVDLDVPAPETPAP
ncbi:hypothetical protein [Roseivivax sp. CAU 1761]